jgi:two-component system, sensor histidine kinase RpfC
MVAPLAVAVLAGPSPRRYFGTVALATSLLGPGLAMILVCWRGIGTIVYEFAADPAEPLQAMLRIYATAAALAYIGALALTGADPVRLQPLVAIDVAAGLCAWLLLLHMALAPTAHARRGAALAGDVLFLSLFLHWGDAAVAPCAAAYLALMFDYGMRFDRRMLIGAAIAGAAGFTAVVVTTPVWRAMPFADAALLVSFFVLPPYGMALADRLAEARTALAESETGHVRLRAILAHELRAPLNTLIGLAALLGRTRLEPAQRDMAATIEIAARSLIAVARQFLEPARPSHEDDFVLREALGDAAAVMRPQAEALGFTLALVLDPRLPHICRGLRLELSQLVMNLLRQEIDRAARRDIVLAAALAERTAGSVRLRIIVRAEGPAAAPPPERLAGLFAEADANADESRVAASIGAALAEALGGTVASQPDDTFIVELTLACEEEGVARPPDLAGRRIALVTQDRELAERLQASLAAWRGETQWYVEDEDALSVLGAGGGQLVVIDGRRDPLAGLSLAHRFATAQLRPPILFIAPRQASEAVAGLAATQLAAVIEEPVSEQELASGLRRLLASADSEASAPHAASLRLLVADDSTANREALKTLLESARHRVELAADGGAALAMLDRGGFDLALLDLEMPGVSGDAVAKLHRLRHPGDEVPLVALVADGSAETAARCREAGFDAIVTKPADAAQLLAAIAELRARTLRPRASSSAGPEVTPISSHPRFLADGEVVREATIESLRGLGGNEFLAEVVETFRNDAARLIPRLREAAQRGELAPFADLAHALRSGAANIGGVRLAQTLAALEDLSATELRQAGATFVEKIESELHRLEAALEAVTKKERRG